MDPKLHRSRKAPKVETINKKEDGGEKGKCSKMKTPEAIERPAKKKTLHISSVKRLYVHGRKVEAERSRSTKAWQDLLKKRSRMKATEEADEETVSDAGKLAGNRTNSDEP